MEKETQQNMVGSGLLLNVEGERYMALENCLERGLASPRW